MGERVPQGWVGVSPGWSNSPMGLECVPQRHGLGRCLTMLAISPWGVAVGKDFTRLRFNGLTWLITPWPGGPLDRHATRRLYSLIFSFVNNCS